MPKVLLAEDDSDVVNTVENWLIKDDFMVDIATNGREALERLAAFSYDAIILDWEMPETSGVEVLRRYRAQGGTTPIIMLTGKAAIQDKEHSFESGADDYLTKPFHPRELVVRIRALLRRPVSFSTTISISDITIDTTSRIVKRGDQEIDLQPNEFRLLELLMKHPNRVFSSDELLRRCWNSEESPSPDAVYSCVRRLRRKLDVEGKRSLISTVHGIGYRLESESDGQT